MTRLGEIAIFTDDVPAAAGFYARLLDARPTSQWPGGASFDVDGVAILVHERGAGTAPGPPNEDHLAFTVSDLDATCAALSDEGLALLVGPRDYDWGRSAYLRDPDGRLVELSQA